MTKKMNGDPLSCPVFYVKLKREKVEEGFCNNLDVFPRRLFSEQPEQERVHFSGSLKKQYENV